MKKAAVIAASGLEEGETLTIVDILRRAGLACDLIGLEKEVEGGHGIVMVCDDTLNLGLVDYDMIILPGGYGGVESMCNCPELLEILQRMDEQHKYVCAMCAAPYVLDQAGLLEGRTFTAYPGYDKKIAHGHFVEDEVAVDSHLVTSRGPATVYAFAYRLAELLGADSVPVKERMLYSHAFVQKGEGNHV